MSGNPQPSDGQPFPPGILAAIDEAAADVGGGVHYLLAAAVVVDGRPILSDLAALVVARKRGFHWHREGPEMRDRMLHVIEAHGVVAHVRSSAGSRRGQIKSRRALLAGLVPDLVGDGVAHLTIESRGRREDGRDRGVLLDTFRDTGGVPFSYDWRTKAEPVLWMADAIVGACREHLIGGSPEWHDRLVAKGVISGVVYP